MFDNSKSEKHARPKPYGGWPMGRLSRFILEPFFAEAYADAPSRKRERETKVDNGKVQRLRHAAAHIGSVIGEKMLTGGSVRWEDPIDPATQQPKESSIEPLDTLEDIWNSPAVVPPHEQRPEQQPKP